MGQLRGWRLGMIALLVTAGTWAFVPWPPHGATGRSAANGRRARVHGPPPLTQAMLDQAVDPGIAPNAVVGMVNGWPITGTGLAQMEVSWANSHLGRVGSPTLRQEAFMALAGQIVAEEAAKRLGLWPSLTQAEREAVAERLTTTRGSLQAIQARDAMLALRKRLFPPGAVNDASVWDAYVTRLLSQATVIEYPPLARSRDGVKLVISLTGRASPAPCRPETGCPPPPSTTRNAALPVPFPVMAPTWWPGPHQRVQWTVRAEPTGPVVILTYRSRTRPLWVVTIQVMRGVFVLLGSRHRQRMCRHPVAWQVLGRGRTRTVTATLRGPGTVGYQFVGEGLSWLTLRRMMASLSAGGDGPRLCR